MPFVRAPNPIWFMVDLVGQPLNDEYYAFFLTNTLPYVPQVVYRDNQGNTPWTDPLEFYPNGTLPDNLYFDDSLVYRIEIRRGPLQSEPLIYEINNFIPDENSSTDSSSILTEDNQISNSQFSEILFTTPSGALLPTLVITTAGNYQIAPDWFLTLTGSGTTTITQQDYAGSPTIIENPPFALRIASSGWTSAILYQRFENNGAIWSGGAVAMSALVRAQGASALLSMQYVPSSPGTPTEILAPTIITTGDYSRKGGIVNIPASTNTATSDSAYVDMQLILPPNGTLDITNVQVIGQTDALPTPIPSTLNVPYKQETINRQIDHLFNYYAYGLISKPIKSYLVGWDFPLNPSQFNGSPVAPVATGNNKSYYLWDQTILFQSVSSGFTGTRQPDGSLGITAALTSQFALIQYLDVNQAREILKNKLSVNVSGKASTTFKGTVSLWYSTDANLPVVNTPTFNSLVLSLDTNGKPATFNGNWTEVPLPNSLKPEFNLAPNATAGYNDYPLGVWDLQESTAADTANWFAIVVGFQSIPSTNDVFLQSISLVPGEIATRPAPQTYDEVQRECEFYYEKSYNSTVVPGTADTSSQLLVPQNLSFTSAGGVYDLYATPFNIQFRSVKRTPPTTSSGIVFYASSTGAANMVDVAIFNGTSSEQAPALTNSSDWKLIQTGTKNAQFYPNNGISLTNISGVAANAAVSGIAKFQYTIDSRLGVV